MAPEVSIQAPSGPFYRRVSAEFTAAARGESAESLSYRWGHVLGACPASFSAEGRSDEGSGTPSFALVPNANELGPLCVWVQAKDEAGASAVALAEILVLDRPPIAKVTQVFPAPGSSVRLGTNVVVEVAITDPDGESVSHLAPTLRNPDGMDVSWSACEAEEQNTSNLRCFVLTSPGTWQVSVQPMAKDSLFMSQASSVLAIVGAEDQAPCLITTPASAIIVQDANKPLRLEASVQDDLDSAPATGSQAVFLWSVADRANGPFLADIGNKDRFKVIGENRYRAGDELRVRIDVEDRVPRVSACKPSDDACGAGMCKQRMTWKVQFR